MSPSSKRSTQEVNPVSPSRPGESDSYIESLGAVILTWAGKDATATYDPIHPPDTLDKSVSPFTSPDLQDLKMSKS